MTGEMIKTMNEAQKLIDTRWQRKEQNESYPYNGYIVLMVTNLSHEHPSHPPQVVYKGDNGKVWSLGLSKWPGNLEPETEDNFKKVQDHNQLLQDFVEIDTLQRKDDEMVGVTTKGKWEDEETVRRHCEPVKPCSNCGSINVSIEVRNFFRCHECNNLDRIKSEEIVPSYLLVTRECMYKGNCEIEETDDVGCFPNKCLKFESA